MNRVIVCGDPEVRWRFEWGPKRNIGSRRQEVLAQVREFGGFSVFWATDNQARAIAATQLDREGAIVRKDGAFPWCAYKIAEVIP